MKLVRYDGSRTGLLVESEAGPQIVDVLAGAASLEVGPRELLERELAAGSWLGLIDAWGGGAAAAMRSLVARAEAGTSGVPLVPLDEVELGPPIPGPESRIFAMGGNFRAHVAKSSDGTAAGTGVPDSVRLAGTDGIPPWGFFVIPGTIVGDRAVVTPPAGLAYLDYEAEVAVVLDSAGEIWGITAWNDLSIRDEALGKAKIDHGPLTWSLQKNFAGGNVCGPCLVVDEGLDPTALAIASRVNGDTRQTGDTAEMTFGFDAIAAYLGTFLPLSAGDMILSGSPAGTAMESGPEGPFLGDGDLAEVEVEGVGVLTTTVAMPSPERATG